MSSVATALQIPTGTWNLDPAHTEVTFVARHAMVTKVRGVFRDVEGTITVADDLAESSATAQMQTASVDTGSADRDAHLRAGDFFDSEVYPTMSFASTGVSDVSEEGFVLTGDLTIKDVTRPVQLNVEFGGVAQDPYGNLRAGFSARTQIEREDWGLNFNAKLETGGVLVSKKITIEIEVSAIKA
ncbi:YceI family protein [Janibacter sp. GXQ6167]|uniref:YceI family protein n=1 Tax=Janibacter sp. GXQ6167 TaxID=3240791 RepID=UPI0035263E15